MWASLEQKIVQINKVTGIEIIFFPDDKWLFSGVILNNKKNAISRETEISGVTETGELFKKLNPQVPVSLVFNGKGILVKKIPAMKTGDNPVSLVLPNANPADFFYEVYQQGDVVITAITRKEPIEKLITAFKNAGFKVLQVSIGFGSIANVLPFFTNDQAEVVTNNFTLFCDAHQHIHDFKPNDLVNTDQFKMKEYAIGDQYIRSLHLLAFAAAIHVMTGNLKFPPILSSATVAHERTEFRYFKLFRFAGMALLASLFFILLLNFLIYSHYFNKNKELATTQLFSREKQHQSGILLESIGRKEKFLQQSGWIKPGKVSFYADRIASLTPSSTLLTTMAVYPLKGNASASAAFPAMNFRNDTIEVTGSCDNPVEINQFINNLKILPEFRLVSLKNYTYKKERETAIFSIEIVTR